MKRSTFAVLAIVLWAGICAAGEKAPGGSDKDTLVLGTLSSQYEPVRFNHTNHISMAGGCADCHHQHGATQVQSCTECHPVDLSIFKKKVEPAKLKACRECHPASGRPPGSVSKVELKSAYHQACLKCHKKDVGDGIKTLADCAVMCHAVKGKKAPAKK